MTGKLKNAGALSQASSGSSKSVASGLAIIIALFCPVDIQVYVAGALPPVLDWLLPRQPPWK